MTDDGNEGVKTFVISICIAVPFGIWQHSVAAGIWAFIVTFVTIALK